MAATLIGFTGIDSRAQSPEELLFPAVWQPAFALRSGGGYKDNVFLSSAQREASAFVSAGADVMVLRLAPMGPQFNFAAGGDWSHFLSTEPAHDEYTAFAQAQLEHDFRETITGWFAADYFYQDQVLDVTFLDPALSGTNVTVVAAPIRGHALTLKPGVSVDLSSQSALSLELPVARQYYEHPLDDYWKAGLKLTLGYSYGRQSQLSLNYEPSWRFYDNDPALTTSGAPIPGSHRERFQHDVLLTWRHHLDEAKHWRTLAKLGGRLTEENGGGFADYGQLSASTEVRYRARRWEVSAEGRVRAYRYDSQTVSATDLSKRRRTDWTAGARFERQLTKWLRLIASYEHEETLSNDATETYRVNTVSGSLQWEF
jgi:hypothetical protein